MTGKRLVSVEEAAEYAEVSIRTIRRWRAVGLLTTYRPRVGHKRIQCDLNEIDALTTPSATKAG